MRRKLKLILYAVYGLFLILIIFLSLEVYTLFNFYLTEKNNRFVINKRKIDNIYTKVFGLSLWEKPWQEYKKNAQAEVKINDKFTHQIKINSFGFRTKEIQMPKPKGVYRIICIGGSTTFEGMSNEKTYPSWLERKLNGYFKTDKIEVLNCGISGLSSGDERNKLGFYLNLEPDLIIEYNAVNDIFWKLLPRWESSMPRWKKRLAKSAFLRSALSWYLLPSEKTIKKYLYKYSIANIVAMNNEAKKHNVVLWVCSFAHPDLARLNKEEINYFEYNIRKTWKSSYLNLAAYCGIVDIYNKLLEMACAQNNIPFIPVAEHLKGNTEYFLDICHLFPRGIWEKANIIFVYLKNYLNTVLNVKLKKIS